MLRKAPSALRPSAEDRLHRALALLLGAVAGVVLLTREPSLSRSDATGREPRAASARPAPTRAELEAAIRELARWFEGMRDATGTSLEANVMLLALGRALLEAAPNGSGSAALVWKNLDALARRAEASPAALPLAGGVGAERDATPAATLAILLETGAELEAELPLASGPMNARQLLARALPARGSAPDSADPWTLDLLSFAVLAGLPQRRGELERQTLASLGRLEREQRPITALMGDGAPAPGERAALASELGRRRADGATWSRELQLGAAVFRAVAVLGEPDLEQRALRHLNALSFRQQLERELLRQRLAEAKTAAERIAVRLEALEALGRLEQSLYGAHLAFRREGRPGPSPRTAASMRSAAGEMLDQLEALKQDGAFGAGGGFALRAETRAAAAQALRGLRAARVAL